MYVPGLKYRATNTFFQSNGVETKCQLAAIAASLSAQKNYHLSSVTHYSTRLSVHVSYPPVCLSAHVLQLIPVVTNNAHTPPVS